MAEEEADTSDSLEDAPEELLEGDEIDDREEGFMKGYDEVDSETEGDDAPAEKSESSDE